MGIESRIQKLEARRVDSFTDEEICAVMRLRQIKLFTPEQRKKRIAELLEKAKAYTEN